MSFIPSLSFGAPWILAAFAVLPAIWWLLRVTPPAPRRVMFPPLRLLEGLAAREESPARTPLWLLALRLLAVAAIIVALAEPLLGQAPPLEGQGPLILFVDNGWTAAARWNIRAAAMADALASASHANRAVAIVPTASPSPPAVTLMSAGEAERRADEIAPEPWLPDRFRTAAALARTKWSGAPEIVWLSDGLDYGDGAATARALAQIGRLRIYADAQTKLPLVLPSLRNGTDGFVASVARASGAGASAGEIAALGAQGETLATAQFRFRPGALLATAAIRLPLEIRNETERIIIENENSAGAVRLLGSGSRRRAVEIVSARNDEQPLLSDAYYLKRALAPYADVQQGTIADALARNVSMLVLADVGTIAGADHDHVARFVEEGGIVLRFAGGRMTQNVDDLVPVKLRVGGRYLGGALAWAQPQRLAPFPDASPFRGLSVLPEVTVSRQILAEPSIELGERSWARLADGTPLVTGAPKGKGWLVLVHVTANPAWSSLPLSGLYVDMLRRLLDLAGGARPDQIASDAAAVLPPTSVLDGFGHLVKPGPDVLPLRGSEITKLGTSPAHPPGLYGHAGAEIAFNAADDSTRLTPLDLSGTALRAYLASEVINLEPYLLALAIAVLLGDACITLGLRGYTMPARALFGGRAVMLIALVLMALPIRARADDAFDMTAALDTRLAYVVTGIPEIDAMSKAGLMGLGLVLKARTSYEPQDPVGVDLDKDELSFFPLLYWPMDPREHDLSPRALSKVADYMRNGGTILFDTRDLTVSGVRGPASAGEQTLRRLAAKLDLPPLEPVPADHVLTKTFYLIQDFPGRWDGGKLWIEALPPPDPDAGPARGGDGVSPVIIGGNDWAAAWAVDAEGRPLADVTPGGDDQRELAYRFGINVVMYALTGNYKTDQVHAPALLERLGH